MISCWEYDVYCSVPFDRRKSGDLIRDPVYVTLVGKVGRENIPVSWPALPGVYRRSVMKEEYLPRDMVTVPGYSS